jgi:HPt (histidine-containing phosphotransfer) domain-containing protein
MTDAAAKTESLLAALWLRNRPIFEERVATLERAARSATAGDLPEALGKAALDAAHKLSGSLGMYGYDRGTLIARELELMLDSPEPDPARLSAHAAELRQTLFPDT